MSSCPVLHLHSSWGTLRKPLRVLYWGEVICCAIVLKYFLFLVCSSQDISFLAYLMVILENKLERGECPRALGELSYKTQRLEGKGSWGMLGCFLVLSLGLCNVMDLTVVCIVLVFLLVPLSVYLCLYIHQSLPTLSSPIILFTFLNIFISICITSYYLSLCPLISCDINIC